MERSGHNACVCRPCSFSKTEFVYAMTIAGGKATDRTPSFLLERSFNVSKVLPPRVALLRPLAESSDVELLSFT